MSRNIHLVGMMGSGKTTVGRVLAERLGRGFVDTDDEIVRQIGRPISQIFAEAGEASFRAIEHQVIRDVARADDLVVALGGGAVLADANVAELLVTGVLVELRVAPPALVARLSDQAAGRPLLTGAAGDLATRIEALAAERAPRYAEVADFSVDGDAPPVQVAEAVLAAAMARGDVLTPSEHEHLLP